MTRRMRSRRGFTLIELLVVIAIIPLAACPLLAAIVAGGCGEASDPMGRQAVSGQVLLKGQSIDQGSIRFSPAGGAAGISSGAMITNGSYSIPAHQGLPPGTYLVQISAPEGGVSSDELPGDTDTEESYARERVPPEYNSHSKQTVEVKAGAENKFDFSIP